MKNYEPIANLNSHFHILNNFTRFKTLVHVLKTPKLTYVFQALLTKKKEKKVALALYLVHVSPLSLYLY